MPMRTEIPTATRALRDPVSHRVPTLICIFGYPLLLLLGECSAFWRAGATQLFSYRPRQFVFHLRRCFLLILCAQDIHVSTDVLIVINIIHEKNKTESSLYTCIYNSGGSRGGSWGATEPPFHPSPSLYSHLLELVA